MSTPINDGGPAFANKDELGNMVPGMSLRDYFAGQALASSFSKTVQLFPLKITATEYAESLYGMADAMIAARNQKGAA